MHFKIARKKEFERSQHKEMISVWGSVYAEYPDMIITNCVLEIAHCSPKIYVSIMYQILKCLYCNTLFISTEGSAD